MARYPKTPAARPTAPRTVKSNPARNRDATGRASALGNSSVLPYSWCEGAAKWTICDLALALSRDEAAALHRLLFHTATYGKDGAHVEAIAKRLGGMLA